MTVRTVRTTLAAVLILLAGGCSMTPEFKLPKALLPDAWTRGDAAATLGQPTPWWRDFRNDELNRLIAAALANNRDLRAAVARIAQAQIRNRREGAVAVVVVEFVGKVELAQIKIYMAVAVIVAPGHGAGGSGTRSKASRHSVSNTANLKAERSFSAALTASYELDFWGRNRASVDSAEAALRASAFDRDTVALTLSATVASTYFQALALADRIAAARRNLGIAQEILQVIEQQAAAGTTSGLEAAQQRSNVAQIAAQIPALELQRLKALDALAILTGQPPSGFAVAADTLAGLPIPAPPPGLPSDLLQRRPDIKKAEADLVAANANIGVARANLFPSIRLTGERGLTNASLSNLVQAGNLYYSLGSSLTATIFDNGALRGAVKLSEARYAELVEAYHIAVLASLRDVEDGLASATQLALQEQAQATAVAEAREAYRLADVRYRAGAVDYISVLDAQRTLLQVEDNAVQVRQARLDGAVGLFKALAGDMGTPPVER